MATVNNKVEYELSLKDMLTGKLHDADAAANKLEGDMMHLKGVIGEIGVAIGLTFGIEKLVEFGKEILHTTAEFEGFTNKIRFSAANTKDAQDNITYLDDAITRLHLPMRQAKEGFSDMAGAFYGTAIQGKNLRDVFEGVNEAALVLHLDPARYQRTVYALQEIGELGTVQARQMRMLAIDMGGGVMQIAANSMHMTTKQFHEAMHEGTIDSSRFLLNFSKALKEHFSGGLETAGHSLISQMNDVDNEFIKLQLQMGEDLRPVYIKLMQGIIDVVKELREMWHWAVQHKQLFFSLGQIVKLAVEAFVAYKTVQLSLIAITKLNVMWQGIQYASITVLGDGFLTANKAQILFAGGATTLKASLQGVLSTANFVAASIFLIYKNIQALYDYINIAPPELTEAQKKTADEGVEGDLMTESRYAAGKNKDERRDNAIKTLKERYEGYIAQDQKDVDELKKFHAAALVDKSDVTQALDRQYLSSMVSLQRNKEKLEHLKGISAPGGKAPDGTLPTGALDDKSKAHAAKATTINIKIDKQIGELIIQTTNIQGGTQKVKELLIEALSSAVNDAELTLGA